MTQTGFIRGSGRLPAFTRMPDSTAHRDAPGTSRRLAWAHHDFRLLLAPHMGGSGATPEVRAAAELAYALHNLALAAMQGASVSEPQFLGALARAEHANGETFVSRREATFASGGSSS